MTFSQFVAHWTANRRHVAASVAEEVRRAAVARLQERMSDGGANAPLCFADLVQRMEAAVGGMAKPVKAKKVPA
jgi:hypothetical protein